MYFLRICLLAICASVPLTNLAQSEVITTNTVWSGEKLITEDILVAPEVTLTIRPGTVVRVATAESTKTDPEYLSPLTEITVRGQLLVEGTEAKPVIFRIDLGETGRWGGLFIDGGQAELVACRMTGAETGITFLGGSLHLQQVELTDNRYGLVVAGKGSLRLERTQITGNDYGLFSFIEEHLAEQATTVTGNRKRDRYASPIKVQRMVPDMIGASKAVTRTYGDDALLGETIWRGRIEIKGLVRVPEGSRLVILPGTVIEFHRRDTNGDGIGENGLLLQGVLLAKGSREHPITFRSAERNRRMGDWDAINIMNSDSARNLVEHCRIEDAYRGLHFHFANVAVVETVLRNSFRGIQFQESAVSISNCRFEGNRSGVQGRDSEVSFTSNLLRDNYQGANFLRCALTASANRFSGTLRDAFRVREGVATVVENQFDGNRFGLQVADTFFGKITRNVISGNAETGLMLRNTDNLDISGNIISGNGLSGVTLQESRGIISGNAVTDNGERGIGVISFAGAISRNNLAGNGLFAIDLEGAGDLAAPDNWWNTATPAAVICDRQDEPARGVVQSGTAALQPYPVEWPMATVESDVTWRGWLTIQGQVRVVQGNTLTVAPGTTVAFADGAGLAVSGRLQALGRPDSPVRFTGLVRRTAASWDEVILEHAQDSRVINAVFQGATWGLHSHFTNLVVADSLFQDNFGGIRFRSGPVTIKGNRFLGNTIGVRAYRGTAQITENSFSGNETAIFVREQGSGLAIHHNNFLQADGYAIRLGDFNTENVQAADNWWDGVDPGEAVFDDRREPGIGRVITDPQRTAPVQPASSGRQGGGSQ